jgi:aminomethyltransferase
MVDQTMQTAMVAIQGPQAIPLAQELAKVDLSELKRYRFIEKSVLGMSVQIYRQGYTGEDGLEVVVPAGVVSMLVPHLLGTAESPHPVIKPAGLGARDTLRLEAGMPLYGHELTEDWDSLTAGQGWCVDLTKDFIGVEPMRQLKERGLPRQIVGLELDGKRIARQHYKVVSAGQRSARSPAAP